MTRALDITRAQSEMINQAFLYGIGFFLSQTLLVVWMAIFDKNMNETIWDAIIATILIAVATSGTYRYMRNLAHAFYDDDEYELNDHTVRGIFLGSHQKKRRGRTNAEEEKLKPLLASVDQRLDNPWAPRPHAHSAPPHPVHFVSLGALLAPCVHRVRLGGTGWRWRRPTPTWRGRAWHRRELGPTHSALQYTHTVHLLPRRALLTLCAVCVTGDGTRRWLRQSRARWGGELRGVTQRTTHTVHLPSVHCADSVRRVSVGQAGVVHAAAHPSAYEMRGYLRKRVDVKGRAPHAVHGHTVHLFPHASLSANCGLRALCVCNR